MSGDRVAEALRGAVDLNVRYVTALLKLSTDYLQSLGSLVGAVGGAGAAGPQAATAAPAGRAPPVPPLLLVGHAGEEARAAFLVHNALAGPVTAQVVVRGEGSAARAIAEPATLALDPGREAVVTLRVMLDAAVPTECDHPGEIAIPGLSARTIPFVVRRVEGPPPAAGA
jgi:hypothetical protein